MALFTDHDPPSLATHSWFFPVCLPQIVAAFAEVFDHYRHDVVELAFLPALSVTRGPGLVPSSRIAHRTWNDAQLLLVLVSVHIHVVPTGTIRIPAFPIIPSMPQPSSSENIQRCSWNRLTAHTGSGIVRHLPLCHFHPLVSALNVLTSSLAFF